MGFEKKTTCVQTIVCPRSAPIGRADRYRSIGGTSAGSTVLIGPGRCCFALCEPILFIVLHFSLMLFCFFFIFFRRVCIGSISLVACLLYSLLFNAILFCFVPIPRVSVFVACLIPVCVFYSFLFPKLNSLLTF